MKHPTNEEWMGFIYGEIPVPDQNKLQAHLRDCALCRDQVDQWRQTTASLDDWPEPTALSRQRWTIVWKVAAALVACATLGFAVGRQSVDAEQIEARLQQRLEAKVAATSASLLQELAQKQNLAIRNAASELASSQRMQNEQVIGRVTDDLDEKRAEDQAIVQAALQRLATQLQEDYLSLRKGLETVAVMTEAGLLSANQQLVTLANYQATTQP